MIICDFIIGGSYIKGEVKSKTQLPKVNEITFLESVDEMVRSFERIFKFAESNGLSQGGVLRFSLNLPIEAVLLDYVWATT